MEQLVDLQSDIQLKLQQQLSTSQITHQCPPLTSSTSYPSSSSLAAKPTHTSSSISIAHQPVQPMKEQTNQLMAIAEDHDDDDDTDTDVNEVSQLDTHRARCVSVCITGGG